MPTDLSEVLRRLPIAVIVIVDDDMVEWANEAAQDLLGEEGRPGGSLARALVEPMVLNRDNAGKTTVLLRQALAPPVLAEVSLVPLAEGRTAATLRLPIASELAGAERLFALERRNADLNRFASIVSHDLQEPLRSLVGFSQLLERRYRDRLDEEGREFLDFIDQSARRMQRLVDDVLEYTRLDHACHVESSCSAADAVARALLALRSQIEESAATVVVEPLPPVSADPNLLTHLFQNLISNAIKFRSDEPPVVTISASPFGAHVRFAVSDNGIGIPAEHRQRVFDIFQRVDPGGRVPGTGIGLAISKKIVETHGGTIWVDASHDSGACVCFTIPAGV